MPSDLITTSYLGTFAGLVAVTYLLVQFFKDPLKARLGDWWVRMLAVVIAFVIQGFVLYVGNTFTVEAVGLALLNAFLVAITAAGAHNLSQSTTAPDITSQLAPLAEPLKPQVQEVSPPVVAQPVTDSSVETTATQG